MVEGSTPFEAAGRHIGETSYVYANGVQSKYTADLLEPIVLSSTSMHDVLRALGVKITGGSQGHVKRLIDRYGISTKHFTGRGSNRGPTHKGGVQRLRWQDILVFNRLQVREHPKRLRRAMLEAGIPNQCDVCGMGPVWNHRPLRLQIDHKNGNWADNRKQNVRFICPNCHTQTETFGSKNKLPMRRWRNGRRTALRWLRVKPWGFKSPSAHKWSGSSVGRAVA